MKKLLYSECIFLMFPNFTRPHFIGFRSRYCNRLLKFVWTCFCHRVCCPDSGAKGVDSDWFNTLVPHVHVAVVRHIGSVEAVKACTSKDERRNHYFSKSDNKSNHHQAWTKSWRQFWIYHFRCCSYFFWSNLFPFQTRCILHEVVQEAIRSCGFSEPRLANNDDLVVLGLFIIMIFDSSCRVQDRGGFFICIDQLSSPLLSGETTCSLLP